MEDKMCLGIDVSKKTIDCCLYDGNDYRHKRFNSNNASTVSKIIKNYKLKKDCKVVMEATGVYHTNIFKSFYEKGFDVVVENPLKIKSYSKMKLCRVKTDKADAKLIAEYGYMQVTEKTIPRESYQEELAALLKLIDGYQCDVTVCKNRLEALNNYSIDASIHIDSLNRQISNLNKEIQTLKMSIREIIASNCEELYQLYLGVAGVGPVTASSIIANFGNFSRFEQSKQAANFVGICPSPFRSGTSVKGSGSISKKGNPLLRKTLYMAALTACRRNKACYDLYTRLVAKGKNKKLARIAAGHKLLRQLFAIAKSGRPYDPDYEIKMCENRKKVK